MWGLRDELAAAVAGGIVTYTAILVAFERSRLPERCRRVAVVPPAPGVENRLDDAGRSPEEIVRRERDCATRGTRVRPRPPDWEVERTSAPSSGCRPQARERSLRGAGTGAYVRYDLAGRKRT